jgi:uncharacterized membrane protein YbhN (UPF0104 family)
MVLAARLATHTWKAVLVLAIGGAGLWTATHGVAGVTWKDVALVLARVTPVHLLWLTVIWLGGLGVYAGVLAAALPGLGRRRGLLLNLTGSAVANVVPLGGAVATALNWRMVRRWGHSNSSFVSFCVTTNVLDVCTKLVLPLVAVAVLVALSVPVPATVWALVASCLAVLLLVAVVNLVLLRPGASRAGRLRQTCARMRELLVGQWRRLLPASLGYVAAQVLLLDVSLVSVGLRPPVGVVLMAAAIERVSTVVAVTPGGTGVAEIGTVAWLVATGSDPVEVVAGVLLYRAFLFVLEIPVGGVLLGGWAWRNRGAGSVSSGVAA